MSTPPDDHPVIDLEPTTDPATGKAVFAQAPTGVGSPADLIVGATRTQGQEIVIHNGSMARAHESADLPATAVTLTDDRFAAGYGDEFTAIENAQDAGEEVRIVSGQFVTGGKQPGDTDRSVSLTDDRFAAVSATDAAEIRTLVRSGAAQRYIHDLRPTSDMPQYFPDSSKGLYLRTKDTKHGDRLHVVIEREASTGLYHAHLWLFQMMTNGQLANLDLNAWVGEPGLSAHDIHLYPGRNDQGAVLCLSTDSRGGMPSLSTCVVRCAQWAAGMGEVVRGRPFPFRQ